MSTVTVRGSTWMMRQKDRTRRLIKLLPGMFDQPRRVPRRCVRAMHITILYGYVGLKAHFRKHEAHWQSLQALPSLAPIPSLPAGAGAHAGRGYVIWAPPYVGSSAGIGCLYRLCHELRLRGIDAYISGSNRGAPHWNTPLVNPEDAARLCREGYAAVYPETIRGNPLGAGTVVRWVLNRPGLLGGDAVYDENEHIFYYSEVYRPYIRNRIEGKLYVPTIDETIFFGDDQDGVPRTERTLECYYIGKSSWKEGYFDRDRTFEITRSTPPKSELGKLFRAARVLYCFDNSTILIYEALMCGCPVVVIPDGTQQKEDYMKLELGIDGIAWGLGELPRTKLDLPRLQERYQRIKSDFELQLDHFIAMTYKLYNQPSTEFDHMVACCDW